MAVRNKRHQRFIEEYFLQNMNGTEAYQTVYPKASRESARREASRLLTNVDIQAEIKARLAEKTMSADEVLVRLAEQARGEHSKYLLPSGIDFSALLADGKGHLVHKIKQTRYGLEIEFYDAQSALVNIGKHHGLFVDRQTNLSIDITKLSVEQLERIANGDDPLHVLADSGQGGD